MVELIILICPKSHTERPCGISSKRIWTADRGSRAQSRVCSSDAHHTQISVLQTGQMWRPRRGMTPRENGTAAKSDSLLTDDFLLLWSFVSFEICILNEKTASFRPKGQAFGSSWFIITSPGEPYLELAWKWQVVQLNNLQLKLHTPTGNRSPIWCTIVLFGIVLPNSPIANHCVWERKRERESAISGVLSVAESLETFASNGVILLESLKNCKKKKMVLLNRILSNLTGTLLNLENSWALEWHFAALLLEERASQQAESNRGDHLIELSFH